MERSLKKDYWQMDNVKRFKNGKTIAFIDLDKKEVVLIKTTKGYLRNGKN